MESFLFHPVQLDKKMNICYHIETQSPPGDIVYHRGVAQLVARVLWEHDAAGSSPVTPTKIADLSAFCGQIGANFNNFVTGGCVP